MKRLLLSLALALALLAGAAFAAAGPPPHLARAFTLRQATPPQLKAAIAEMRLAIDQELNGSPRDVAMGWMFIGDTYRDMGEPAQAEKAYRQVWPAMRDNQQGRYAALQLARLYASRKQYDRAMAMFDEVLPLMKEGPEIDNLSSARLGIICAARRWERAVQELDWLAARNPGKYRETRDVSLMSHGCRIAYWLSMEKPRNTGQLLDHMLAKLPAASVNPQLFCAFAHCDRAIGRPAATLKWLPKALAHPRERDAYLADAHFHAGLGYERLKDKTHALQHFNKVLDLAKTGDPYAKSDASLARQHLAYVSRGMTGKRPAELPLPTCRPLQWTPGVPATAKLSGAFPVPAVARKR